jgi:hypothetical protein
MTVEEYVESRKYCRPSDRTSFMNGIEEGKRQSEPNLSAYRSYIRLTIGVEEGNKLIADIEGGK